MTANLEGGGRLLDALAERWAEYGITAAFWVKLDEERNWLLYVASPAVDREEPGFAYRDIYSLILDAPEWGIDPFEVRAVGERDPMAAAANLVEPRASSGEPAASSPKAHRGIAQFGGSTLGDTKVEGAYIYPPSRLRQSPGVA